MLSYLTHNARIQESAAKYEWLFDVGRNFSCAEIRWQSTPCLGDHAGSFGATPPALVFLGLIFWPILWLVQPATVGAYPFYFAGYYPSSSGHDPIRSIDWLISVPITIVQWILLSILFAWGARRFPLVLQVTAAVVFYFFMSWLGNWIAQETGIELVYERPRM